MNTSAQNVDKAEIAKFDALAARWWDPESDFRPLHAINPLRLDYIRQRVQLSGASALDIGCGGGILTESMATAGATVTGIDMADRPLAVARLHMIESGLDLDYRQITAEALAAEAEDPRSGQFDLVTCLEMLEHVPSPSGVIAAAKDLVRPGGDVFFSTINRTAKAFVFAIVGAEYVLKLLPAGTHEYEKFIRPSELEAWARQAGLTLQHSTGMHYNPLTGVYRLGPGLEVNYLMHFKRIDD